MSKEFVDGICGWIDKMDRQREGQAHDWAGTWMAGRTDGQTNLYWAPTVVGT